MTVHNFIRNSGIKDFNCLQLFSVAG
uniref:Uncharacterized protein n=1 Tax=Arundo donax TaxID=35708 RepID=A0A0A9EQ44_ARUDO